MFITTSLGCGLLRFNKTTQEINLVDVGGIEPNLQLPQMIIKRNTLRRWHWIYVPIRTFYAWLFKLVKLEDLITKNVEGFEGQFYPIADDQAMMFPMLEMASDNHIYGFPNLMYIANMSRPETDCYEQRLKMAQAAVPEILSGFPYQPLSKPTFRNLSAIKKSKATLLVFSHDPENLLNYLHSINTYVTGIENICVLFDKKDIEKKFIDFFNEVHVTHSNVKCFDLSSLQSKTDFTNHFNSLTNHYVVLADSKKPFKNFIDIGYCNYLLEKTFAYGFYFNLDLTKKPETVHSTQLVDDIYLWKFNFGKDKWANVNNTNGVLYRKNDLSDLITNIAEKGIEGLNSWKNKKVYSGKIGLFWQNKKL